MNDDQARARFDVLYATHVAALYEVSCVLEDNRASDAEKLRTIARILRTAGVNVREPAAHEEPTGPHQARQT